MIMKKLLKQTIALTGFELVRKSAVLRIPETDWLERHDIRTFIDIGANVGEYINFSRSLFPQAEVYAFEPLVDCYDLIGEQHGHDPRVHIYNYAVSDSDGKSSMNRSSYAPSSSLLKMASLHKETFPESAGETSQPVEVRRLDSVMESIPIKPGLFVKIDVQGSEDKVIEGGKNTLSQAAIVQIETSFEILYKDQVLFDTIYEQMKALGFSFHGVKNQVCSPKDGAILQAHAYFIKKAGDA